MDAEELLQRYAAGERNFSGVDLREADLSSAELGRANL
ncbi:pentapeptide repeat-containing protein, partial [Anabaena cylindrica UHCC 0172]